MTLNFVSWGAGTVRKRVPAMIAAFCVDECACSEPSATIFPLRSAALSILSSPSGISPSFLLISLSLAATSAVSTTSLAVPWMIPPPSPALWKQLGKANNLAIQSITTVSNSVTAGEQIQLKAAALNAPEYISPNMAGYDELHGKKAMNLGDCQ